MPTNTHSRGYGKIAALLLAVPLIGAETALNAEDIAASEGWLSTLVIGTVAATLSAAAALPIAERAWREGSRAKAFGFMLFFAGMLAYSFTTSVGRVSRNADNILAQAQGHNGKLALARQTYEDARNAALTECATGRGSRCRDAEAARAIAYNALMIQPAAVAENSMARRISQATGFSVETVELYQPLLFPLMLHLGGFIFLAYALAPRPERREPEPVTLTVLAETKPEIKAAAEAKQIRHQPEQEPEPQAQPSPEPEPEPELRPAGRLVVRIPRHVPFAEVMEREPLFSRVDGRNLRPIKRKVANDITPPPDKPAA